MPVIIPQTIKTKYLGNITIPKTIQEKYAIGLTREEKLEKIYTKKPWLRPEEKEPITFKRLMGFKPEEKPFELVSELERSSRLMSELGTAFKTTFKELPKGIVDMARGIVHAGIEFPASFALNLAQLTGVSKTGRVKIPAIGEIRSLDEQYKDWLKVSKGNEAVAALGFGSENLLKLAIFSSWAGYRNVATIANKINKAEQLAYKQLGVKPKADIKTITTAFRKQAQIYHPDKWIGKPGAESAATKFKEINNAYNFLKGTSGVKYTDIVKASEEVGIGRVVKKAQETKLPVVTPLKPKVKPITIPTKLPSELPTDPETKIIGVLKEAKPVRKIQETLYATERGKRLAEALRVGKVIRGEKGFYAELAKLKGELPKVQFETIRGKISQVDIDTLFIRVQESRALSEWDKISARSALAKLFGEAGVKIPTEREIVLLNKVLSNEFTKTLLNKRPILDKFKRAGLELANIPRALMASFDLSAPFRQGLFLIGRPKEFWSAFGTMFKTATSEKAFTNLAEEITRRPTYQMITDSKLALTEIGHLLSEREEVYMSRWAEKIPIIGKGVRISERAYVGFLNKLRADTFDSLVSSAEKLGLKPEANLDLTKAIANFVNNATGRGSIGALEKNAVVLNTFFFSPRLMASRLRLLNPLYYIKQPPFVRREALKNLFILAGTVLTILGLAKMGGADVEGNPKSADFAKIKIGKTRLDILGGFQQYIKTATQLITGEIKSSTTGRIIKVGEGYKPITRLSTLSRALEYKQAPLFSFITNLLRGETPFGEELEVSEEVMQRFIPMVIQDLIEIINEEPSLLPFGILGIFGVGIQTY